MPGIRFPICGNLDSAAHKVSLLVQSTLGAVNMPLDEGSTEAGRRYTAERISVMHQIKRMIKCMGDIQIHREDSTSLLNTLMIYRSLSANGWDDRPHQLRQIPGIGTSLMLKLVEKNVRSIEDLGQTEAHEIEMALKKPPPFGRQLLTVLERFPKLSVVLREKRKPVSPAHRHLLSD